MTSPFRAIALVLPCVLSVASSARADEGTLPPVLDALGKMHFLLLHFPIALLWAVVFVEVVFRQRASDVQRDSIVRSLLGVAALAAVASSVTGLIHASGEEWSGATETMLVQHRLGGLVTTACTVAAWYTQRRTPWRRIYLVLLVVAAFGVAAAGHRGGELVHGEGYLLSAFGKEGSTSHAEDDTADEHHETASRDEGEAHSAERERWPEGTVPSAPDYAAHIKPIFERSCVKCHGPEKRKGALRLDQKRFAMKGGETGPAIVAGNVSESLLIKYVSLPLGDEDLMPSRGKLLARSEIETLKVWIAAGAVWPEDN